MSLKLFIILSPFIPYIQSSSCHSSEVLQLFPHCPNYNNDTHQSDVWWLPLQAQRPHPNHDLCQQAQAYRCQNAGCDFHNLLSACIACNLFPGSQPPSFFEFVEKLNESLVSDIMSHNCTASPPPFTSEISVPSWIQHNYGPLFDPSKAVQLATPRKPTLTTASAMTMNTPPASTSPDSVRSSSTPTTPPRAAASNAGPIAGGVVGGVLLLSLIIIGVLYYRRLRNRHRVAPSAEFMFLSGSNATYARAPNDSPPPITYTMQNPSDPVLEKAYRSAEAQRRLDSQDSSHASWENHV